MSVRAFEIRPEEARAAFEDIGFQASEEARLVALKTNAAKQLAARNFVVTANPSLRALNPKEPTPNTNTSLAVTTTEIEQDWDMLADTRDTHWSDRAACTSTDPEAFFPEKNESTREAKKVCLSCDVRKDCLEYALDKDESFGVWGGLTERERRRLKKNTI